MRTNNNRNKAGAIYIGDIIAFIALIVAVISLMFVFIGNKQGPAGPQGLTGPPPEYRWNGTALQLKSPNGTWGPLIQLKGDKGEIGGQGQIGPQGIQGIAGKNGTNAMPNIVSTVNITDMDGDWDNLNGTYLFTFDIDFITKDKDDATVEQQLFYRFNDEDVWNTWDSFFSLNVTQSTTVYYETFMPDDMTINWLVRTWDGQDINFVYDDYTVTYP